MQTVVIDGIEYVLVPKEDLQPTIAGGQGSQPPVNSGQIPTQDAPEPPSSILDDFAPIEAPYKPVDDGLATPEEKEESIRVVLPDAIAAVPKAQPKVSAYREKYMNKELMPTDVYAPPKFSRKLLEGNPEDPMIKLDAQRPQESRLFYGPGIQYEGF